MLLVDGGLVVQVLIAFATIGVLALVLWWAFRRDAHRPRPPLTAADPEDFGLLGTVAVVDGPDEADRVRALLGHAGIRATVSRAALDGTYHVLVFSSELDRARRVGGWSA